MESKEIFNRIEHIINDNINKTDNSKNEEEIKNKNNDGKTGYRKILYLLIQLFLNILKAPFKIVAKYLKNEIIAAVKKDAKIYMLIMGIMGILFVFFSVIWLFISVAVGAYCYNTGHTILMSIIYSIGFQIISFVLIALIAFIASRQLTSLKVIKKLNK